MYSQPWVGVDLDGTLAHYDPTAFAVDHIGEPIEPVRDFVRSLLYRGVDVRIFTARVGPHGEAYPDGTPIPHDFIDQARQHIEQWCLKHLGRVIPVTATKDYSMVALYDDRAVQLIPNEGIRVDGLTLDGSGERSTRQLA